MCVAATAAAVAAAARPFLGAKGRPQRGRSKVQRRGIFHVSRVLDAAVRFDFFEPPQQPQQLKLQPPYTVLLDLGGPPN